AENVNPRGGGQVLRARRSHVLRHLSSRSAVEYKPDRRRWTGECDRLWQAPTRANIPPALETSLSVIACGLSVGWRDADGTGPREREPSAAPSVHAVAMCAAIASTNTRTFADRLRCRGYSACTST